MFPLNMNPIQGKLSMCLLTKASSNDSWLWHKRFSHLNFKDINKVVLVDLVRGLPLLKYDKENLCVDCELKKKSRKSHSSITITKIIEPLELIHIDLYGPSSVKSIGGNKYTFLFSSFFLNPSNVLFELHKVKLNDTNP